MIRRQWDYIKDLLRHQWRWVLWGLLFFLIFLYLRLPLMHLSPHFEQRLEQMLPPAQVNIGEISTTLLPGIRIGQILFNVRGGSASFTVEEVRLRLKFVPLLLRKFKVAYTLESAVCQMSGAWGKGILGRNYRELELELEQCKLQSFFNVDFLRETIIEPVRQNLIATNPMAASTMMGIKLQGEVFADVALAGNAMAMEQMRLADLTGSIKLQGKRMAVEGLLPGVLDLGELKLGCDLEAGKLNCQALEIKGRDLQLNVNGNMKFENPPKTGSMDLNVRLAVPSTARDNLAGSLNMILVPLGIELKEGKAAFTVSGALGGRSKPRIVPSS